MDEVLLKQLVRQVKILNFWVSFFGVLFIATFVIAGILLFKAVTYIHHADQSLQSLQTKTSQTLNVEDQACQNGTVKPLLQRAGYCQ